MDFIINFLTKFIAKYFTEIAIEKIILILLKKLVESTESKIDDEVYNSVFEKTRGGV